MVAFLELFLNLDIISAYISCNIASSSKESVISVSSNLKDLECDETPFLSALINARANIRRQYFFPSHQSGNYTSDKMKGLIGADAFYYDLPELDGLDNIHNPEVLPAINY